MSSVHIFGAGPTGLTLAWIYGRQGRHVTVYEKYSKVGGSWAAKWTPEGEFTHHSPQILSGAYVNTFDLFREMDIEKGMFLIPYDSNWREMDMELSDYLYLAYAYMTYVFKGLENVTVAEYFKGRLSEKGSIQVYRLCYLLDGVPPSVMTVDELFRTFDQTVFYPTFEMSEASDAANGMGTLWQKALEEIGVKFRFDEELKSIKSGTSLHLTTSERSISVPDNEEVILALDARGVIKVLDHSPDIAASFGPNWRSHLGGGIYNSLSLQFHLSEDHGGVNGDTQKGMSTEWGIICVQLPGSVTPRGVTLSATILDISLVEGIGAEAVKREAWRQIRDANPNLPREPDSITIGEGTSYSNGSWSFDMSGYARTTMGPFNPRGEIQNLSIVGPMNSRRFGATTMEAAVEAAKLFAGSSIQNSSTLSSVILISTLILFMISLVIILI